MITSEDLKVQIAALQIELQLKNKVLCDIREYVEKIHDFTDKNADVEELDSDLVAYDLYELLNGYGSKEG